MARRRSALSGHVALEACRTCRREGGHDGWLACRTLATQDGTQLVVLPRSIGASHTLSGSPSKWQRLRRQIARRQEAVPLVLHYTPREHCTLSSVPTPEACTSFLCALAAAAARRAKAPGGSSARSSATGTSTNSERTMEMALWAVTGLGGGGGAQRMLRSGGRGMSAVHVQFDARPCIQMRAGTWASRNDKILPAIRAATDVRS